MVAAVKDIPFFKGFSQTELKTLSKCLKEQSFKKGQLLASQGDTCSKIFFVKSGRVNIHRSSASGREQILEALEPGSTCACHVGSPNWQCMTSAEAATDCEVWFFSREVFEKLVRTDSKISQALNTNFAERFKSLCGLLEEVSLKDTKKRLVKFLLDLSAKSNPPSLVIELPFTREEIAEKIGTARETVTRHLNELQRKKYLLLESKRIHIRDLSGLKNLL